MDGPQGWAGVCTVNGVATVQGIQCAIANVLSVAVTLIGLIGFVMLLIGAFRYLVSGGNSKETEGARNTITYAIIGLIVALASFIILNFIADFTGVDIILDFTVPEAGTTPL